MSVNQVSRAYNNFRIEPFGLIRKSSSTDRLADEIGYYKTIQRDVNKAIFFPRLIASHVGDENWVLLERYGYNNLGEYLRNAENTISWTDVFDELAMILSQFETFNDPQGGDPAFVSDMIEHKTNREFGALYSARPDLQEMFDSPTITLNGDTLQNFKILAPEIFDYVNAHMLTYTSTMIHGDMCFSNILYSNAHIFKFIDPRGSFGKKGIFGDQRYDIAKLYHSVDGGYEFIINDKFDIEGTGNDWELDLGNSHKDEALQAFEDKFFKTGAFKKKDIKIIQGCIYIGMCARHYDSTTRQEAMYLTGIRLLNEGLAL